MAPVALTQLLLPGLRRSGGAVLCVTSDAAVEAYAGWGGYGAAKAALEQACNVLAAEESAVRVWWVDPGDLRTRMHQDAFPGEDISDRPLPESVTPGVPAPDRGAAAERPVPGHRPASRRGWPGEYRHSTCPRRWRHTSRRRPAARPGTTSRCWSAAAGRARSAIIGSGPCPELLRPGDLLVVNNSGTLPAAVPVSDGLSVHFSTVMPDGGWLVELRLGSARHDWDAGTVPYRGGTAGDQLLLPGGALLRLGGRFTERLWRARLSTAVVPYLLRYGSPIRYSYVRQGWPIEAYQTVFATVPGSAEMPSAARPFSPEIVTRLVSRGVTIAPITLHTGVSSLEGNEDPYPEVYDVPPATARLVTMTRAHGGRVIAAGTTVVRALETAAHAPARLGRPPAGPPTW